MQSLPCLDNVIWFSRRALIDIPFAERYTELSHIIVQGPSFGKKGRLRAFIERHFRGSKPLQIFTKLRPIIVYIYTIVACACKWKSSAARSAFNLTAETQGLSSKVHSIGTTEPMRPEGTSAQTSRFISIALICRCVIRNCLRSRATYR